jgi:hypothetical protein
MNFQRFKRRNGRVNKCIRCGSIQSIENEHHSSFPADGIGLGSESRWQGAIAIRRQFYDGSQRHVGRFAEGSPAVRRQGAYRCFGSFHTRLIAA